MISWPAARCDGADYGHLFEFAFSKDKLFYGPYQIQARINQNPQISRQLSLWNQIGSKVILGNLLVIPLADTLLYVEPLYLRAQNGQLPELQRVLASYGDRIVMGEDLESTLAALLTGTKNGAPVVTKSAPPPQAAVVVATARAASAGAAPGNVTPDLQGAASHYNRASYMEIGRSSQTRCKSWDRTWGSRANQCIISWLLPMTLTRFSETDDHVDVC
jgi:uncharacterized membrane protein (UPF0182 family)